MIRGEKVGPGSPFYGHSIEIRREYQTVSSIDGGFWNDDPQWTFTDRNGHEHYREGNSFPTLREVEEEESDGYETWVSTYHECIGCGEPVRNPGRTFEYGPARVPMTPQIFLDGKPISEGEFNDMYRQHLEMTNE